MRVHLVRVCLLLALTAAACQSAPPPADLPFHDDFSRPGGWTLNETNQVRVFYENEALHFIVNAPDQAAWSTAGWRAGDFVLDVDATQVDGPDNNHYGVIVRFADSDNFYRLDISGDGYYSIQRKRGKQFEVLIVWPESAAIRQGAATNHIRVTAEGPRLTLTVNDQVVDRITDADILEGDVGLTAGTFPDETGVHIAFDNFEVRPLNVGTPQP